MMNWYEIKAKADVSEVWIYDEIGYWGITAKEFIVELNALTSQAIDLHINSPGGEVFDGAAIYNAIIVQEVLLGAPGVDVSKELVPC